MPLTRIAGFEVRRLEILDEHGDLDESLEPKLAPEQLLRLYRVMSLAREGDQRLLKLQRQGRVGTFGPTTGQEAPPAATALAMTERDWFVGAFRELSGMLMRGVPLSKHYIFHNGWEEGNVFDAPRTLPISIIVGAQTLHAVGLAYAAKLRGERDTAAVTFFGDGATSEGDFHEALNFAGVWQVPVVFVCQNNQWAISIPRHRQTHAETLAQKAIAYGIPSIQVDGNDPLAVYSAAKEALDRAHAGGGPTLIEAVTYRLMMHTTSDDPTRYRDDAEVQAWWKRDPLVRFRKYLERKGLWDDAKQAAMEEEIRGEVEQAVRELEAATGFPLDAPFEHVLGTRHEAIDRQRAEFLATRGEGRHG